MAAALPTLLSPLLSPSGILLVVNSLQLLKELYGLFRRLFDPVKASSFCDIPAFCH